jgi:hypothetical protein
MLRTVGSYLRGKQPDKGLMWKMIKDEMEKLIAEYL